MSSSAPLQEQIQEWYVQAFAQIQEGTIGAIALADEADAAEAASDEGTDTPQDMQRKLQKVLWPSLKLRYVFWRSYSLSHLLEPQQACTIWKRPNILITHVHEKIYRCGCGSLA